VRELQTACSQPLGFFVEVTAAAMAALGIAIYYSWNLTLVILACVPVTIFVLSLISRRLQPAVEQQKRELNTASRCSHTAINAVDTVKIFHAQDHEVRQYACAINGAAKSYRIQAHANSMQMGVTRFMTTAMFVVGFWYGTFLVEKGLSPGRILTTFYSCLMATQAAEQLLPQWLVLTRGISAGKTLEDIFNQMKRSRVITKTAGALKPENCCGDVEMSNVRTI
jgi:ATP-binding cassette, subfamily B (MDR/TAP), member 1